MDLLYKDIVKELKDKIVRHEIYEIHKECMPGFLKKYKLMRFKESAKNLLNTRKQL